MRIFSYFLGYAFLSFRMKIHQCYKSHKRPFHVTALAQLTSHHHQKDEALIPPKSPQAVPSLTLHLLWQLPNCTAKAVWITREVDQEKRTFSCWVRTLYGISVQFHRHRSWCDCQAIISLGRDSKGERKETPSVWKHSAVTLTCNLNITVFCSLCVCF